MVRRVLMSVFAAVVTLAGLPAPDTASAASVAGSQRLANVASPAACTGGVSVTQFAFSPPIIEPTGSSDLVLVLKNCGTQAVQGSTIWYGRYVGQGCPVLDPGPATPFTIAVGSTYELTDTFGDPGSGCQPTSLRMNVNVNVNGVGTVATASATLGFAPACTGSGIAVDLFSFSPAAVMPTENSTLTLVLQNCTGQDVKGETAWYPRLTWSGTGPPPGCPNLDPLAFAYSMAPGALFTASVGIGDPIAGCLATGLHVTADVYEEGSSSTVAGADADLVITQPAPSVCHVTFTPTYWPGGFTADVTITNNTTSVINGWSLTFAFPGDQKITNAWNATVTQNGTSVTAVDLGYNASITPGGSQSLGFQGTWTLHNASPTAFSVNGALCS